MATVIIKGKIPWQKWENCHFATDGMIGEKMYLKIGTPKKQLEIILGKWEIR